MPERPLRSTRDISFALPEPRAARRASDRAARTLAAASFLHDRASSILGERLDLLGIEPRVVLDLGCGPGLRTAHLAARYPAAVVVAVDWSRDMCIETARVSPTSLVLRAEAARLPLNSASVDLVFANLCLPSSRPDMIFAEVSRTLTRDGLFVFATLGPDTLREVREAWLRVDDAIHVHAAFDAQTLGDWLAGAGLGEPVVDVERLTLHYPTAQRLHADLRATGASNVAAGRRRALTGARRWRRYVAALEATALDGRISISCELILGAAWGRAQRPSARQEVEPVRVPVSSIRRRSLS